MNRRMAFRGRFVSRLTVTAFALLSFTILIIVGAARARTQSGSMGHAIAISGEYSVVGAQWVSGFEGAAYILKRDGNTWTPIQELLPGDLGPYDHFGASVAIDGDHVIVGAPWQDLFRGAVYVFRRDGQRWLLQQTLLAGDGVPGRHFGESVEVNSGLLTVAPENSKEGTVYRFALQDGQWVESGREDAKAHTRGSGPPVETSGEFRDAIDAMSSRLDPPPAYASAAGDTVEWVTASDGVFEGRVDIKWSPVERDAILYKILRDGALIAAASSNDSLYSDVTGARGVTYTYCVVVQDMTGGEGGPVCDTGSRVMRAPARLAASDGQFIDGVHLTWEDRSSVEDGFYVRREGALIATVDQNTRFYVDETAVPLTTYNYEVLAFDSEGDESGAVADSGFRGVVLPPLAVTASDGEYADSVHVTWADQGDESGFVVTRYNLVAMDTTVLDTTAMDAQEYFDETPQLGARYLYCVVALDAIGQLSVPGCDEGGIDLVVPANVAASDSTFDDRIQITWEDKSGLADGYYISRDGAPLDTVGATVRTYNDKDVGEDATHSYCVVAFNDNGGVSEPGCDDGFRMIILASTNVQATDGKFENRTRVSWESKSTTVAIFKIYRDGVFIKSVGAGARFYDDEGGAAGKEYIYGVQAVTGLLQESTTANDAGRRELKPPIAVAATDDTFEERVEITWRDISAFETGYVIYRTKEGTAATDSIGETGANTTSFVDRTGVPGTTYLYGIAAFDIEGEARGQSGLSDQDEGIRSLLKPTSVDATDGLFEDRVEITWADKSNAEDGYRLYRNGSLVATTGDNVTSVFDMSPMFGVATEYSVRAFDAYGMSGADADSGSTMLLAPGSFNASDTYEDRIELRWVDVSDVETAYVVATDSAGSTLRTDTLSAGSTSFTDMRSAADVVYEYGVYALAGLALSRSATDTGVRTVPTIEAPTADLALKLIASDGSSFDRFGDDSDISGDRVIVGAPFNSDRGAEAGTAYIFVRNEDGTYSQETKLSPGDGADYDLFGFSVTISGDLAFVGSPLHRVQFGEEGAVYIYERDAAGNWSQSTQINGGANQNFGFTLAANGERFILGSSNSTGFARFYTLKNGSWTQTGVLTPDPAAGWNPSFRTEVDITDKWAILGAEGSAHIFDLTTLQEHKLIPSVATEYFGREVAISGDWALVSARDSAFVYVFDNDVWTETEVLAPRSSPTGSFPSVSTDGGLAVLGSLSNGSCDLFRLQNATWEHLTTLSADGARYFGWSVAIDDGNAIIGDADEATAGAAYIFESIDEPGEVSASDGGFDNRVHLQWRDRSDNEDGFIVFRDGVERDRVGRDTEFYDDFDAEPGRTYEYSVSAASGLLGISSDLVSDFGWRPPNGNITGRVTSQSGVGVEGVSVCLEPAPTRALLFDGEGGHVRIPEDGTFNFRTLDEFTIEVWFSYSGSDRSPRLLSKLAKSGADKRPLDLGLQRNGRLFFAISDGANFARVLSKRSDLNDDTWHHVACLHDAGAQELVLYVDGVEEDRVTTAGLGDISNDSDIFIGGFEEGTWFGGQIDELRVWEIARTASELRATSTEPLAGNEEGLVGYWPLDAFSGTTVTDIAGDAQYGVFVGGVYRTENVAPLDVCGKTDSDGSFVLTNVRYDENGTDFKLRPSLGNRRFSPAVQPITLNREHPVENQLVFNDISSHEISGYVQFSGVSCFQPDVEVLVDGVQSAVTDKNGKFTVVVTQGEHSIRARLRDYTFRAVLEGDTASTDSVTIDVTENVPGLVFLNETSYPVSGKVGGGCDRYVGEVTVRFRSENNCLDTTFVANPGYTIDLPPMKYFASATIDRETIPESLVRPDVIEFFQNLGEREVNLVADTDSTVIDDTLDFIYRAPLRITVEGFEDYDPNCRLELEDGTLLPAGVPVIPQGTFVKLTVKVEEVYGDADTCPLDTGMVVVFDEIFDQENHPDTLYISGGEAEYRTFASTPSLVRGRTEGTNDRSFQKLLTLRAVVDGRAPVIKSEWVLVTGHVAPEGAEFVTVPTTELPLFILRDPPGDGSYAYIEEGVTGCARMEWTNWSISAGLGPEFEVKLGATQKIWVGVGGGTIDEVAAHTALSGKLLFGGKVSSEKTYDVCVTTTERFATSEEEDFIGGGADLYLGAGITFLFSEVGVIDTEDCVVKQSTSVAFEPDSIHTAFAYTERHITDILIPELESKVAYFQAHDNPDSAEVFENIRNQWQYQVDYNTADKLSRVDTLGFVNIGGLTIPRTAPRATENRSWSAGTEYEFSSEESENRAWTFQTSGYIKGEAKVLTNFGIKSKAEFMVGVALETDNEFLIPPLSQYTDTTKTWTIGYVLSDDDTGDNFTVDIVKTRKWGYIFDVLGGRSSCPYEPWVAGSDGASMVRRDNPLLFIDPKDRFGVSPDDIATFKLTIANMSDERRDYVVKAVSNSNPGGAIMRLNGAPITDEPIFFIDGLGNGVNSHEATLTVERGPSRFSYDRLALVVEPVCGGDAFGQTTDLNTIDTVFFNVSFEGCSEISMRGPDIAPGWIYNHADSVAGKQLDIVLDGYELVINRTIPNLLEAVGIQYRYMGVDREGPGPWIDIEEITPGIDADISQDGSPDTIMVWQPDSLANGAYEPLKDGIYEVRAYTVCSTGGRGYSEASQGTIDRRAPVVFGTPHPSDGQLSLGEDIGITFNEPLDCDRLEDATVTMKYVDGPLAGQMIEVTPVCNGESLVLVPDVDPVDMDGRRLEASVSGVVDRVGNTMASTVTWQFDYRRSLFTWSETRITRDAALVTPGSVAAELVNGTAEAVDYAITDLPSFLTVAPGNETGRLAQGGKRAIALDIDPLIAGGIHEGQVTVQAVNTAGTDTVAVATLDVVLDVSCAAPQWLIQPGDFEHSMSVISRVAIEGGTLTGENDLLAAFVGGQLRGVARPRDVAGDTLVFLTVFSNRLSNETVRFEVWDDDQCRRYPGTLERFAFSADAIIGTPSVPVTLTAAMSLPGSVGEFALDEGWNWFSTNVNSSDMSVVGVLSTLAPSEGDIIKSKTEFASFDPATPAGWVGSLTTLDNTSGYMVRLTDPGTILQEGSLVDPSLTDIPVASGWNWISYAGDASNNVTTALASLDSQGFLNGGEVIKGQSAFAQWDAGWIGSLDTMVPGQGYRLFLQSGPLLGTFNYPANAALVAGIAGAAPRQVSEQVASGAAPKWAFEPNKYQYNMTVIADLRTGGVEWRDGTDVVGAFVGNECRGIAHPMHVGGVDRYLAFVMVHSNRVDGEVVEFRAFDAGTELTYEVLSTVPFESDAARGTVSAPLVLATSSVSDGIPAAYRLVQNHPNPFNPQTTIRFELPSESRVVLTIYNVGGQLVRTLVDRGYGPGRHRAVWDGATSAGTMASSGVYFYRLTAGSYTDVKKMVLLK